MLFRLYMKCVNKNDVQNVINNKLSPQQNVVIISIQELIRIFELALNIHPTYNYIIHSSYKDKEHLYGWKISDLLLNYEITYGFSGIYLDLPIPQLFKIEEKHMKSLYEERGGKMHFKVLKEYVHDRIDMLLEKINFNGSLTCAELESIIKWDSVNVGPYHYETIKDDYGWTSDELLLSDFVLNNILDQPGYVEVTIPLPKKIRFEVQGINDSGQRISYGEGKAVREPSNGKGRFDLITPFGLARLARWYELGAQKYSDRNWEKGGIPFSRYTDSTLRHMYKYIMGMTDEDHLSAAAWNILCIMHHQELNQLEMDDMPHYLTDIMPYIEKEENKDE